jgi:quercetin dioxygenase-like cupin family protein
MGKLVSLAALTYSEIAPGVRTAAISGAELKQMAARAFVLDPGTVLRQQIDEGSDCYLYVLTGNARLAAGTLSRALALDTFATIEETTTYTLTNTGDDIATIVSVATTPGAGGRDGKGFRGGIALSTTADAPKVYTPADNKTRFYFVDERAAHSDRGHVTMTVYEKDTVTAVHSHPNADNLFILLTGRGRFHINGEEREAERGDVVYYPAGDLHGVRVSGGTLSFVEFHAPARFNTLR